MPEGSEGEQREEGRTGRAYDLERYDLEAAIGIVRELGEGLVEATKHSKRPSKHHFRREWVDQLVERYRRQPGKPVIHLDDLYDDVIPSLSAEAGALLLPHWKSAVQRFGFDRAMSQFRCQRDIVATGTASRWSRLANWRKFCGLTGLSLRSLEPYVVALRASNVGTSSVILNPKLPFDMATPAGARMIGYRGDAAHETSAFVNLEHELHNDYRNAITETIGVNPFTTTYREDGVNRTNVGVFVTMLASVAGLDTAQAQKLARNPLPSWFFVSDAQTSIHGLRSLYDAEGSATSSGIQLGQVVAMKELQTSVNLPPPKAGIRISRLEPTALQQVEGYPPLLLVSASLLLHKLGIVSFMSPEKIWKTNESISILWNLAIHKMQAARLYANLIGFTSPTKRADLQRLLESSSPSSFFFLQSLEDVAP